MRFPFFFTFVLVFVLLIAAMAFGQTPPQSQPSTTPANLPAAPSPASPTPASSDAQDWAHLQQLDHDQPIRISASGGRSASCLFTGATGSMLFCEPEYARRPGLEFHFSRADVQTVRLDQTDRNMHRAIIIPTVAGAAAGVVIAAVKDNRGTCPTGLCELAGGVIGAFVGASAGFLVALPAGLLIPGKRIYHRASHASSHRAAHLLHSHPGSAAAAP